MAILAIFLIEQLLRIIALRCAYFRQALNLLDLFVITLSLALEVLVTHLPLGGLLVIARVWRFARAGHGAIETVHKSHKVMPALDHCAAEAFEGIWSHLPDRRWEALAHGHLQSAVLHEDEKELVVKLSKSHPEVMLKALASESVRMQVQVKMKQEQSLRSLGKA